MDKTKITVPPADAPREQEMQFIHDLFIYTLSANLRLLNFRRLSRAQDEVVAAQSARNLDLSRRFAFAQQVDERIAAVTLAEVNAAWRRHFDLARVAVAWGGDFAPK